MAIQPSQKLSPKDFVQAFLPYALQAENSTGINRVAILTQAALESGWNSASPGWMFFGVKDTDGVNGNEQLLVTTEYSRSANAKFPNIISVTPVVRNGQKWFKYKIKDYFRKYNTPAECFIDHSRFFLSKARYAKALEVKNDYNRFFEEIALAGYATAPNYADTLKSVARNIVKYLP